MIEYLDLVSNNAAGTMLKFAAIGVHNVLQYAAVKPAGHFDIVTHKPTIYIDNKVLMKEGLLI